MSAVVTSDHSAAPSAASDRLNATMRWLLGLVGLFLFVFALLALSAPGRIDIVDGQTRYEVARSLVEHGDSIIRDKGTWFAVNRGRNGQLYSPYRIPHSALGVVAIVLADATGPVSEVRRQFFFALISPCMAGFLAVVYAVWFRHLGHGRGVSLAWAGAGIFCTPSWYYGTTSFDDMLGTTAVVLAVAVVSISRTRRPVLGAVVAGLALAWAVNCKPPLVLFALTALAAGYRSETPWRRQLLPATVLGLGVLLGFVLMQVYQMFKYPPGTPDPFEEYAQIYGPWKTINPLPGLASLTASPACGVLWYCPTLLLAYRGWCVWGPRQWVFRLGVLVPSLLFALSISFLTFFKGDPCWGPRYLTPVFALWWVFVPSALERVSVAKVRFILCLGLLVQLLALSADPMRLFVQTAVPWNYFNESPWLGFDPTISHLAQRPREIVEMATADDPPAPEFNPGPLPTHAGCLNTMPFMLTSVVGLATTPLAPAPLIAVASIQPIMQAQWPVLTPLALTHYHIFNAPRPWIFSQWYLTESTRPVDLPKTIVLLGGLGAAGLVLLLAGAASSPNRCGRMVFAPLADLLRNRHDLRSNLRTTVREMAVTTSSAAPGRGSFSFLHPPVRTTALFCSPANRDLRFSHTESGFARLRPDVRAALSSLARPPTMQVTLPDSPVAPSRLLEPDLEVSVVMPCLNEARTVGICVTKAVSTLKRLGVDGEVVVADNGSTDGSQELALAHGARVVHANRRGYGAALQAGIAGARGRYIIMGDADDSYDFTALEPFIDRLRAGDDLVMGNRFAGGIKPGAMPWHHKYIGNPILTGILNLFFRTGIRDAHCGLRAFRKDAYQRLGLRTPGMEFASEMVVKAALHRQKMSQVPTTLSPDGRDRPPHLRSFRDGWRHLRFLLLMCPTWLFIIPALLLLSGGLGLMAWLTPGPQYIGRVGLDLHTMVLGMLGVFLGYQTLWLGASAKVHGWTSGLLPPDTISRRAFDHLNLERGLIAGLLLLLTGLGLCVGVIGQWWSVDMGPLDVRVSMRYAFWGFTAVVLGVQTIFGSFFLSLLGMVERNR